MSGVLDKFDEVQQQIKEVQERKAAGIPPIPRRPLTAYNIFSILERHYILQQHYNYKSVDPSEAVDTPKETNDGSTEQEDPYVSTRPARYKDVKLPPSWYIVGMNRKKRSEHKCHGVIGFKALSKMISDAWNTTSDEIKAYCKMISKEELTKYYQEQKDFKAKYGEEAFDAQKKTYNKHPKEDGLDSSDGKKARKKRKNAEAVEVGLSQGRKCHKKEREKAAAAAAAKTKSEGARVDGAAKAAALKAKSVEVQEVKSSMGKKRKIMKKDKGTFLKSDENKSQGVQPKSTREAKSCSPKPTFQDGPMGLSNGPPADLTNQPEAQSRLVGGPTQPRSLPQDVAPISYTSLGLANGNLGMPLGLLGGGYHYGLMGMMGGFESRGLPGLMGDPLLGLSNPRLGMMGFRMQSMMQDRELLAMRSRLLERELLERAMAERALRERTLGINYFGAGALLQAKRALSQQMYAGATSLGTNSALLPPHAEPCNATPKENNSTEAPAPPIKAEMNNGENGSLEMG